MDAETWGDEASLDCPYGCKYGLNDQWEIMGYEDGELYEAECDSCGRTSTIRVDITYNLVARMKEE